MTPDDIRAELEELRRASNSPKATLFDQRRILKRKRELYALLETMEGETNGQVEAGQNAGAGECH